MVYHNKLDKYFDGSILSSETIQTIEFNREATSFYIGSDKGRIYKYNIEAKERDGEALEVEIGQFGVDIIYCLQGIKDKDIFITYVRDKGVRIIDFNERRIEQLEI